MIRAIDISKHQVTFDATKAKSEGIQLAILRGAYSTGKDKVFDKFAASCANAGLDMGAYHFGTWHYERNNGGSISNARLLMNQQVRAFLSAIDGSGVSSWVAIDQELESNQEMGLGVRGNTQLLNEAAALIRDAGYNPCLYASASWIKTHVDLDSLAIPLWVAYYYKTPKDPDFDGCNQFEDLSTDWGNWMKVNRGKIIGWQYGSTGYGKKYGVASANIDRDWFYQSGKVENVFTDVKNKKLVVTSEARPACQSFVSPNVNALAMNLPLGDYEIVAEGGEETLAGMTARWYKIKNETAPYVLALPDRCRVEDVIVPEPEPKDGLVITGVDEATAHIITGIAMRAGGKVEWRE